MRFIKYLSFIVVITIVFPAFLTAATSVREYTQAIKNSPEDMKYKFYLLRGKAYKDSGEMELALKDLNTSIMLDPSLTAYKCRGQVYFAMERYSDAIDDFTTALEINPNIDLYKLRGESYLMSEIYVLALADGLKVIDMAPNDSNSYLVSLEALENLGDIKLARAQAFKVLSFDRGNKKANEIITKYPLQFVFIGENPVTIYIREGNYTVKNKASEILSRYKKGEDLDEHLKKKLNECSKIGEKIREYQGKLEKTWDSYFAEIRSLKVRSKKIHDDLRNKYLELGAVIEDEMDIKKTESEKCTEELVNLYSSKK